MIVRPPTSTCRVWCRNFSELQAELASGRQDRLLYYAFDILWLDGQDLRKTPQIERKAVLKELFDTYGVRPPILYSQHVEGDGQELFNAASKLNYEGIISKKGMRLIGLTETRPG